MIVLWVSKHNILRGQIKFLQDRLGDVRIISLQGFIPNAEYVIDYARRVGAKYILPVLPLSFIARLCELAEENGITVLWSEMKEIYRGDPSGGMKVVAENPEYRTLVRYRGGCVVYEFVSLKRVRGVKLILEDF
jgi:hypothetical protein